MHLYSNNLSAIAIVFSMVESQLLPAGCFCNNIFTLSQSSLEISDKIFVETPESMIAGGSSNLLSVRSLVDF